jgi:hypothetical protein
MPTLADVERLLAASHEEDAPVAAAAEDSAARKDVEKHDRSAIEIPFLLIRCLVGKS